MKTAKILSLLLALIMVVSIFGACSNQQTTTDPTPAPATKAPVSDDKPADSTGGADATEPDATEPGTPDEPVVEDPPTAGVTYPLADLGTVEMSLWMTCNPNLFTYYTDFSTNTVIPIIEEKTGIKVEWRSVHPMLSGEDYTIMIASGDYTDMILDGTNSNYPGGFDRAVDDGIYVPINDYVDSYPEYAAILALEESQIPFTKALTTDAGYLRGFGRLTIDSSFNYGVGYRRDILASVGYENAAETIDEWEDVFAALKDAGYSEFLAVREDSGCDHAAYGFISAYDVINSFYQVDGKVKFGPTEEGYRQYLKKMGEWYSKGYVNFRSTDQEAWQSGATLVGFATTGYAGSIWAEMSGHEGFYLASAPYPKVEKGQTIHFSMNSSRIRNVLTITTACEDPALACKWADYFYTEEGGMYVNWGVEGITYELDDKGEPYWTNFLREQDGPETTTTRGHFTMFDFIGKNIPNDIPTIDEPLVVWNDVNNDWAFPADCPIAAEYTTEYAGLLTDLETYVAEYSLGVIHGTKDVEGDWDDFQKGLVENLKLDRCLEIKQISLDKFLSR